MSNPARRFISFMILAISFLFVPLNPAFTLKAVTPAAPMLQTEDLLHDISAIAAGAGHTCALTNAGGVKCWGGNESGQIGDASRQNQSMPVDVVGLKSGVAAISAGSYHTCAVTNTGEVKCWGDLDARIVLRPVEVVGLTDSVATVAAGNGHTCALTTAGAVKCWGYNGRGQLGDGTMQSQSTPVNVVGLGNGVVAIAANERHTCALTTDGGVKCWGWNESGQLGDGTTQNQSTPVDVVGLTSGVAAISAGTEHSCALTTAGGVKCWGANWEGRLGDGTVQHPSLTPVDVVGLSRGVAAIAAGGSHTCALSASGGVKCWGGNNFGRLGDGSWQNQLTPVDVTGLSSGVAAIIAGSGHTCALTTAGGVKCWGWNGNGELGDGTTLNQSIPVDVLNLSSGVAGISASEMHTCALTSTGGVKCWGLNESGQLGDGTAQNQSIPVDVVGLGSSIATVATGNRHTCALTTTGGVKCWGGSGLTGDGSWQTQLTPVDVVGLSTGVGAMAAGGSHTCALTTAGSVKCWGSNLYGQLGNGTSGETPSLTPVDVTGLSSGIAAIAAGHYHTCALTTAGRVRCWGWNESGQLGDGTTQNRLIPVDVVGLSSGVTAIAAGLGHTCALTTAAGVQCWGANTWGELGDDSRQDRATPVNVVGLGSGVIAIAAGEAHSCALTTAGAVKCWGANSSGQLGDGAYQEQLRPVNAIGLSSGGAAISAGLRHTCALTTSGGVKCWGANWYGQLGHKQLWVLVDVVAGAEQTVFSVYGRVTDSAGQPLPDVEVEVIGRPSAVTDATGNYAIGGLARGRYTLRVHKTNYTFTPSWQTVDLQQDLADVNFAGAGLVVAPPLSGKPPLLIVHGIQTLDLTGYSCSQRAIMLQQQPPSTLGDMPAWFANSHEVWLAHLTSSALHTPSITDNARCLREQVNQVYTASGNRLVTVVAHSMGGLVTRACLSQSDCRDKVKAVYTLGTPHTGINWGLLSKLFIKLAEKSLAAHGIPIPLHDGICIWQAGYCQMSTEAMLHFNQNPGHYNQAEIKYTFIGGDATPAGFGTLLWALDGRNDGTVGRASAVGWNYAFGHTFATDHWTQPSHPTRYWTSEVHVSGLFHGNYAYSESRGGRESYAFDCIAYHAGIRETALPPWCRDAAMTISAADGATVPDLSQTTPSIADVLEEGQIVTHTLQIDTNGATSFALAWSDGIVDFSLIQPDGQRITPDYAAAHPSQILFTQTLVSAVLPAIATYHFTDTLPGEWQLIIHATDLGVPAMGYVAFAALDSPRTLSVSHSAASYTVAETATFTATLQGTSGSIIGATITATLDLPDGSHDLLTFTEIGNGLYRADYVVPHAGGRVAMSINVSGNDNGVVFYRQAEAIWTIIPEVARFTGVASDHGVDQNNDGAFDALQVDIDIEVMSPSIFSVSAALMQGDLLIDTTATDFAATTRGLHTVSLLFDGSDIAQRKLDGPYIVSQATLHDIDIGDVQIARVERLHTTQDYRASDFDVGQSEAVFLPVIFGD